MRPRNLVVLMCSALLLAAAQAPESPALRQEAAQVVDLLLGENYSALVERFSSRMKQALPEQVLRGPLNKQIRALGAVQAIGEAEFTSTRDMVTAFVPVRFANAAVRFQITFNQAGEVAGLFIRPGKASATSWKPPPYSKPDSFHSEEVTVGEGDWKLPATLSLPNGKGPHPAVVLVHGSGPQDRDETVGAAKPFRDLAEGLASRGVAVLRYEKRTKQHQARLAQLTRLTVQEETVEDAVTAAVMLRAREDIDGGRVFVLGHSLGGYPAPCIGRQAPELAGLIVMAGSTRPSEDLVVEQTAYLAS